MTKDALYSVPAIETGVSCVPSTISSEEQCRIGRAYQLQALSWLTREVNWIYELRRNVANGGWHGGFAAGVVLLIARGCVLRVCRKNTRDELRIDPVRGSAVTIMDDELLRAWGWLQVPDEAYDRFMYVYPNAVERHRGAARD